jgi:hypothetical protein
VTDKQWSVTDKQWSVTDKQWSVTDKQWSVRIVAGLHAWFFRGREWTASSWHNLCFQKFKSVQPRWWRALAGGRIQKEIAMSAKLKVLRNFYQYPAAQLETFGRNVSINLDPTKIPNLPVVNPALAAYVDDLANALAATITGGKVETAAKNKAFKALADALNSDADIVEIVAGGDLELLLSTGFLPASNNHGSSLLDDTSIVGLLNNGTTQVLLRLQPVRNAKTYQVQTSADGGKTWVEVCLSTQARRIVLSNLVPGTTYQVRARAVGGSTGASNWTSPGSIMST